MHEGSPPRPTRLRIFPSDDAAFAEAARAAASRTTDPGGLQLLLRERYPAAVVRARDTLADPGAEGPLWYVFRYGSVVPVRRWWDEPGLPWAILDDERRFVEASSTLAAIVEVPLDHLLGRRVEEFANPADLSVPEDAAALWETLLARGELDATLRFRREDGTPREIEYHVEADARGRGRHLALVREVEPPQGSDARDAADAGAAEVPTRDPG